MLGILYQVPVALGNPTPLLPRQLQKVLQDLFLLIPYPLFTAGPSPPISLPILEKLSILSQMCYIPGLPCY